jgi:hypothetical protein
MGENEKSGDWVKVIRIIIKAAAIILILNLIFALLNPQETIGRLSIYNSLLPGRERMPYGENPQESYNLSLYNLPAMFASHIVSQPKAEDEYRVFVLGDSGSWGWLLDNEETLSSQLNQLNPSAAEGKKFVFYNLGYPIMSLTKDLMFLDEAIMNEPDLIVWPITLESFLREKQLYSPIVQNNPQRVRSLIDRYGLNLDAQDSRFVDHSFLEKTIFGQRRMLADIIRLQLYALSWAATGVDQAMPDEINLRRSDFEEDMSWQDYEEPVDLSEDDLAFDVLEAGITLAGKVPVLIVNEPVYISSGENSDLRYNSFYPRWAYDQYRERLKAFVNLHGWNYVDLWDSIHPDEFTDTPVHLTPDGTGSFAAQLAKYIEDLAGS